MSASLALKPGLSQRFFDWLVSLFSGQAAVRVSGPAQRRSPAVSGAMPVMGRAFPDYELAEVEIVRPSSKVGHATAVPMAAAAPATEQPSISETAIQAVADVEAASLAAPSPRLAARLGAVATLNPPSRRTLGLAQTSAAAIKVERRKAIRRHDVATPRPVVIVRLAKTARRPAKSGRAGR